ncbi:MAG TPA: hypothetical protein VM182_14975, partial [Terriglobia bacterium]|nr:hypothetical protein [Terriglobia bacterium]
LSCLPQRRGFQLELGALFAGGHKLLAELCQLAGLIDLGHTAESTTTSTVWRLESFGRGQNQQMNIRADCAEPTKIRQRQFGAAINALYPLHKNFEFYIDANRLQS